MEGGISCVRRTIVPCFTGSDIGGGRWEEVSWRSITKESEDVEKGKGKKFKNLGCWQGDLPLSREGKGGERRKS